MVFELDFRSLRGSGGSVCSALVPWDTELFGLPVHELRFGEEAAYFGGVVAEWLSELDRSAGCLVCTKVDQQSVPLLEALTDSRFYPVETVLELEGGLESATSAVIKPSRLPARLRPAVGADLPAITVIASTAFWSDRFHLDPNLPSERADRRYADWIERAVAADELVYAFEREDTGDVIGFYHVRPISADTVDLMLAAVDPSLSGLGLGSVLYQSMMSECIRLGFVTAQTRIAARNLAVLNIFSRLQYSFRGATTALHWYGVADRR